MASALPIAPAVRAHMTRASFGIRVEIPDLPLMMRRFQYLRSFFTDVVSGVESEFGAYMRYSIFLELAHKSKSGHLYGALMANRDYITRELRKRIIPSAIKFTRTGGSISAAKIDWAHQVELVLNRNPRIHAIRNAPVEFGFHRSTIRAYGKSRSTSDILAQQRELEAERKRVRKGSGTTGRAGILNRLNYYGRL